MSVMRRTLALAPRRVPSAVLEADGGGADRDGLDVAADGLESPYETETAKELELGADSVHEVFLVQIPRARRRSRPARPPGSAPHDTMPTFAKMEMRPVIAYRGDDGDRQDIDLAADRNVGARHALGAGSDRAVDFRQVVIAGLYCEVVAEPEADFVDPGVAVAVEDPGRRRRRRSPRRPSGRGGSRRIARVRRLRETRSATGRARERRAPPRAGNGASKNGSPSSWPPGKTALESTRRSYRNGYKPVERDRALFRWRE